MLNRLNLIIAFLLIGLLSSCQTVVKVRDGDTFYTNTHQRVRFSDLDCPESKQRFGREARNYTASLILYKTVRIIPVTTDKYGRTIAQVYVDNKWVNKAIVDAGYAWAYKGLSVLHTEQVKARNAKKGMWREYHNIPPFKYRH